MRTTLVLEVVNSAVRRVIVRRGHVAQVGGDDAGPGRGGGGVASPSLGQALVASSSTTNKQTNNTYRGYIC